MEVRENVGLRCPSILSDMQVDEPFGDFLTHVRQQEVGEISSTEVKYSQGRKYCRSQRCS